MSRMVTHCTRSSDGDNSVRHFTKYRAAYFYLYKQYICLRHNATLDWCFVLWCEMALIECDTVLICVRWCEKFLMMFLQIYFWNDVVRAIICKFQKKKYYFMKAVLRTGTEREVFYCRKVHVKVNQSCNSFIFLEDSFFSFCTVHFVNKFISIVVPSAEYHQAIPWTLVIRSLGSDGSIYLVSYDCKALFLLILYLFTSQNFKDEIFG